MRTAAFLLVLLVFALPVAAQQDAVLVRGESVEVAFPQAIRFGLDLTVTAAEVDAIELRVTAGDAAELIFNVSPQAAAMVFEEPEARFRFDWIFTVEQSPHWYDTIFYEWSYTLLDGRTGNYTGEFLFSDPRETWVNTEDPNGNYRVIAPRRAIRAGLDFSMIYDQYRRNTSTSPRLDWVIYPSDLDPGCIRTVTEEDEEVFTAVGSQTAFTLPCVPESLDWVMQGWELLRLTLAVPADQVVSRWLVDGFYETVWRGKNVPDWFTEGLSLFYTPSNKAVFLSITRENVRTRRLLSAQAMRVRENSQEWQAQSYGMIAYMVDHVGMIGVFQLANLIASTADFSMAYRQLMGQDVETLIPLYERWVFSREAELAFGVTPYQPPSPTPSPTFTSPPTLTLTPSPTFTYTPTPTITGVLTRTVAPTITPQPSSTQRPATVTPRPPGSLQTPTPIPIAQTPSALDQPTVRIASFVVLAILLVVLLVLLIRSGGKR